MFIHDALLEYIQSGNTEIQANALAQYVLDLQDVTEAAQVSKLEQQYQVPARLTCTPPPPVVVAAAGAAILNRGART